MTPLHYLRWLQHATTARRLQAANAALLRSYAALPVPPSRQARIDMDTLSCVLDTHASWQLRHLHTRRRRAHAHRSTGPSTGASAGSTRQRRARPRTPIT